MDDTKNVHDECFTTQSEARALADGLRFAIRDILDRMLAEAREFGRAKAEAAQASDALYEARKGFLHDLNRAHQAQAQVTDRMREFAAKAEAAEEKVRQLLDQNHRLREQLQQAEL